MLAAIWSTGPTVPLWGGEGQLTGPAVMADGVDPMSHRRNHVAVHDSVAKALQRQQERLK